MDKRPIIRASELGEYEFCARAWWQHHVLEWRHQYPERLERGTLAHQRHGQNVYRSSILLKLGICLIVLAVVALVLL